MARARRLFLLLVCALTLIPVAVLGIGCGNAESAETGDSNTALEVVGPEGTKSYTLDQIRDMPSAEGYGGTKSSTGRIITPVLIKGVLLEDVFAEVGGVTGDAAVGIVAKDGYEMTLSADQITSGDFITYDMVTGEEKTVDGPLTAVIAYEYDGEPLDPESDGPLRMYVISPEQNQVTDGHWSVKWVTKVQVKAIVQEWTLSLKGKLTEQMDRSTFESGSAVGCHGQEWTDADGNTWTGIPLYLLVGRVDDDISHDGPAYNRDLAEAGYKVLIKTADSKNVELASGSMYYNKHLIVAYKVNGEALPEEYWPLRVVGEGIDAADMVGQITEIEALVPAE